MMMEVMSSTKNRRIGGPITLGWRPIFNALVHTRSGHCLSRSVSRLCASLVIAAPLMSLPASGDETRVRATGHNAFSRPAANMPIRQRLDFSVGNSFFRNPWVAAPSSTKARDGLGPLFNTNACQNCHIKDGRGHAPSAGDSITPQHANVSMLVRLSIDSDKPLAAHQANHVDPHYGGQLQDFALPGLQPEGAIKVDYRPQNITLNGGETVQLRQPQLAITQLAYGPLHPKIQLSARIAPPMIGLGLLEAISDERLRQLADADDENGDGISGRLNLVWDKRSQSLQPGRFGWKAGQPSLEQQNAAAFNGDMGITSSLFRKENCQASQVTCHQRAAHGNGQPHKATAKSAPKAGAGTRTEPKAKPEVAQHLLDKVSFYTANLAVPKRRNPQDASVKAGEAIFEQLNCGGCHTPTHTTRADYRHAWLADQTIEPYTDLLLHDMGEGLADHSQEFLASGREWRTPPLWGIGLTQAASGVESYLHDGRARSLQEAILWHGGEAQLSRDQYRQLEPEQRQALLAFLRDL